MSTRWIARGSLLAALALTLVWAGGCKKELPPDEVPDPAPGTVRFSAAGVRMDVPEDWTVSQYDSRSALGPPSTEVTIKPPDSRAMVQLTIVHLYIRDKTDDELLQLFSLAYTALYRSGVQTLLEVDTQAGKANGMQLDIPAGPTSDGEQHRFWVIRLVGRTVEVHETLPLGTPEEVEQACSKIVMSVGKSPEYMPGQ